MSRYTITVIIDGRSDPDAVIGYEPPLRTCCPTRKVIRRRMPAGRPMTARSPRCCCVCSPTSRSPKKGPRRMEIRRGPFFPGAPRTYSIPGAS